MITVLQEPDKRKAAIVTVVVHLILLLLFLFIGLTQPYPLPQDSGASVEFGWDAEAGGDAIMESPQQTPQPPAETSVPVTENTVEETEDAVTETESDIAVPEETTPTPVKKPEPEKPKEEPKEEPKPTISDRLNRALDNAWNNSGGNSQGETQGAGDQGNPEGTTGKGALGGGSGDWELSGRSMLAGYGTRISDTKEEGIVVLNIWVDRSGKVTRVTPNLSESTTTSQYLFNLAKTDVLNNFRFNGDPSANVEQKGKVRYIFQLK